MPTIAGQPLISAEITMPGVGAWHADTASDGTTAFSGRVTVEIDGVEFVGTVIRSGVNGGRVLSRIVGGAGGLSRQLPAKNYAAGPTVATVLGDILRESGESLAATAEAATTARALPKWHRSQDTTAAALVRLLDGVQASWRVLRDGTIWVGSQVWPEAAP